MTRLKRKTLTDNMTMLKTNMKKVVAKVEEVRKAVGVAMDTMYV